ALPISATEPPEAKMTSGAIPTSSAAYLRMSSALPPLQRVSIRTLRPSVQPNCCSPCRNAAMRACPTGSFAAVDISTPMRRMCLACCPRAAGGHPSVAPPSAVLDARRERPRDRRAAEQRDELAAFPLMEMHLIPQLGNASHDIGLRRTSKALAEPQDTAAVRDIDLAYDRLGQIRSLR